MRGFKLNICEFKAEFEQNIHDLGQRCEILVLQGYHPACFLTITVLTAADYLVQLCSASQEL